MIDRPGPPPAVPPTDTIRVGPPAAEPPYAPGTPAPAPSRTHPTDLRGEHGRRFQQITPWLPDEEAGQAAARARAAGLSFEAASWWWRVVNQRVTRTPFPPALRTSKLPCGATEPNWERLPTVAAGEHTPGAILVWAGWGVARARNTTITQAMNLTVNGHEDWKVADLLVWCDAFPFPQGVYSRPDWPTGITLFRKNGMSLTDTAVLAGKLPDIDPVTLARWVDQIAAIPGGHSDHLPVWREAYTDPDEETSPDTRHTPTLDWKDMTARYQAATDADADPYTAPLSRLALWTPERFTAELSFGATVDSIEVLAAIARTHTNRPHPGPRTP